MGRDVEETLSLHFIQALSKSRRSRPNDLVGFTWTAMQDVHWPWLIFSRTCLRHPALEQKKKSCPSFPPVWAGGQKREGLRSSHSGVSGVHGSSGTVPACYLWDRDASSAVAVQVLCIWPGRGPWPGVQPHGSKAKARHPLLCTVPVPFHSSTVVSSPLHGSNDPEKDCSRAAGQLHS